MTAIKGPPKCMQQLDFHPSLVFVYSELCLPSWRGTQNLLLILRCSICAGFADIPFFVDISSFFFVKMSLYVGLLWRVWSLLFLGLCFLALCIGDGKSSENRLELVSVLFVSKVRQVSM